MTKLAMFSLLLLSGCAGMSSNWRSNPITPEKEAELQARYQEERSEKVTFAQFTDVQYAGKKNEDVQVMRRQPSEEYVELGLLSIDGQDVEDLTALLKMKAARVGADAITDFKVEQVYSEKRKSMSLSIGKASRSNKDQRESTNRVSGVAIRFTSE